MKIQVRKLEQYTIIRASDPVEYDTEDFPEFEGSDEQEFLEFLKDNMYEYDMDERFGPLAYPDDMDIIYDSSTKWCDEWLDCGVPNENFGKNGRFQTDFSTQ